MHPGHQKATQSVEGRAGSTAKSVRKQATDSSDACSIHTDMQKDLIAQEHLSENLVAVTQVALEQVGVPFAVNADGFTPLR